MESIRESAEVYQAKASEYLTSHQLADFTWPSGYEECRVFDYV